MSDTPLVGVAIAVHDSRETLRACLDRVFASDHARLRVAVCDDGSSDGTAELLTRDYPQVHVVRGDGNLWWTGGTNRAIELCLRDPECAHVLLLNPDVSIEPDTISTLVAAQHDVPGTVAAALVVDARDPDRVVWAGSRWGRLGPAVPVWTSRYIHRRGAPLDQVPRTPYVTSEAHGRAVLVPREVFRDHGLFDERCLPHYGADTDFSLRLDRAGVTLRIVPAARVGLDTSHTGIGGGSDPALKGWWRLLTDQKRGDALRVWWHLVGRHVPWYGRAPTYAFVIGLNSFRYWQRQLRRRPGPSA